MKLRGVQVRDVKEIETIAYECPYCGTNFFNKKSYRGHLLKSQYCEIVRYNGYEMCEDDLYE
jgi:uncharacterized C2H2 Zn-finger protein